MTTITMEYNKEQEELELLRTYLFQFGKQSSICLALFNVTLKPLNKYNYKGLIDSLMKD